MSRAVAGDGDPPQLPLQKFAASGRHPFAWLYGQQGPAPGKEAQERQEPFEQAKFHGKLTRNAAQTPRSLRGRN